MKRSGKYSSNPIDIGALNIRSELPYLLADIMHDIDILFALFDALKGTIIGGAIYQIEKEYEEE